MRSKTFYPVVSKGLENCTEAKEGWKQIQDTIDSLEKFEMQRVYDHCYVSCGFHQSLSIKAWKIHMYTSAGSNWAEAGDTRFYAEGQ